MIVIDGSKVQQQYCFVDLVEKSSVCGSQFGQMEVILASAGRRPLVTAGSYRLPSCACSLLPVPGQGMKHDETV